MKVVTRCIRFLHAVFPNADIWKLVHGLSLPLIAFIVRCLSNVHTAVIADNDSGLLGRSGFRRVY